MDGEAQLVHYYLQKGFKPEDILSLDYLSKLFYLASMEVELEKQGGEKV